MQGRKCDLWFLVVSLMLVCSAGSVAFAATVNVGAGGDVQAALNGAQCGDTIVLQAGATYSNAYSLVLPYKGPCTGTDADYITVTTSATLPPGGVRLDPTQYGSALAKLVALSSSAEAVVMAAPLAHHYKFVGIDFSTDGVQYLPTLIQLGGATTYTQRLQMKGFVFDRCFMHPAEISSTTLSNPSSVRTTERAIQLNVTDGWVTNSYIAGFTGYYPTGSIMASEAILADVGPGPLHFINNYLEAWYSNIFLGGSDQSPVPEHTATVSNAATIGTATLSTVTDLAVNDLIAFKIQNNPPHDVWGIGMVTAISGNVVSYSVQTAASQPFSSAPLEPGQAQWKGDVLHDVEIRGNTMHKRPEWGTYSQPKAWIEFKVGRRITMEGNLFTSGTPTVVSPQTRNENGSSPWAEITDFVFRSNKMVNVRNPALSMLLDDYSHVSNHSHGFLIENNLMIGAADGSSRIFMTSQPGSNVTFNHNTVLNDRAIGDGDGGPTQGLVLKDNIMRNGEYGLNCFIGDGTRSNCWPDLAMYGNVVIDNRDSQTKINLGPLAPTYPAGNSFPDSDAQVGFVDEVNGNYRLAVGSPYKGQASDGTDPGANFDTLEAALAGVASPPTSTPTAPAVTSTPTPKPTPPATPTPSTPPNTPVTAPTATPTPTLMPTPNSPPPTVSINSPWNGQTVQGVQPVSVNTYDSMPITMGEILIDGSTVASFSGSSATYNWDTRGSSDGPHSLAAKAQDGSGNVGSSSPVQVTVNNSDTTPPTVYITSPTNGSNVYPGQTINIAAAASDNVGVSFVRFYANGSLICADKVPPYNCSWSVSRKGKKTQLGVAAFDAAGNSATSTVTVFVPSRY